MHENNSSRQFNRDEDVNRICKDGSALHSISLFETAITARRVKAHDDIQQEKRPASSILSVIDNKEDEQDRDELQLLGFDLHKETKNIEETRVKTHNQSAVLPNCQVSQDAASVCQRSYSTPNTPEEKNPEGQDAESSLQKSSLETRLGASELISNTGLECYDETCESQESADNSEHEHSDETDKSTNLETKETTQATQDLMLERKPKNTHQSNKVPCGKIQIRIISASIEIWRKSRIFLGDGQSHLRRRNFSRGVQGHAPPENFENCNANRAILQHLGKNSLFFPC